MTGEIVIALCLWAANLFPLEAGSIGGVVVNVTRNEAPVVGAPVVLRVKLDGQFVVAAETTSDEQGRFLFDDVPADNNYIYLPGANRAGVHYPGSRVQPTPQHSNRSVTLRVHDTITQPNPLVIRQHDIVIRAEQGALRVTETMSIENPGASTYIGQASKPNGRAATMALSIPPDFARTTFHKEFFGRRFTLIDGKLVTDVPWIPGRRQLKFTYVLPNSKRRREWVRPLDLATSNLRITVINDNADEVACNLGRATSERTGEVVFASNKSLSRGDVIRLELGHLPVPFMVYARWIALIVIVGLITGTRFVLRRRFQINDAGKISSAAGALEPASKDSSRIKRARRRRCKQKQFS